MIYQFQEDPWLRKHYDRFGCPQAPSTGWVTGAVLGSAAIGAGASLLSDDGSVSSGDIQEASLFDFTSLDTDTFRLGRESEEFGQFELSKKDTSIEDQEGLLLGGEGELGSFRELGRRGGNRIRGSARRVSADATDLRKNIKKDRIANRGISNDAADLRTQLQDLADQVAPGFGSLTENARRTIREASERESGDLRAQLARRDLSGSSFGINEQRRLALDFALQEEEEVAEALIEEIKLSEQIFLDIGELLKIDVDVAQISSDLFKTEAEALAVKLGAGELEAESYALELDVLRESATVLNNQANRELNELAIAGDIINGVSSTVSAVASTSGTDSAFSFSDAVDLGVAATDVISFGDDNVVTGVTPGGLETTT